MKSKHNLEHENMLFAMTSSVIIHGIQWYSLSNCVLKLLKKMGQLN